MRWAFGPQYDCEIISISDDPIEQWSDVVTLPMGEIGEICAFGPVVTTEYKEEPRTDQTGQNRLRF